MEEIKQQPSITEKLHEEWKKLAEEAEMELARSKEVTELLTQSPTPALLAEAKKLFGSYSDKLDRIIEIKNTLTRRN